MVLYQPMRLLRIPDSFDHPIGCSSQRKMDGFRALAHVNGHRCQLVSRNGHIFKSWPQLAQEMAHSVRAHSLDGEIVCLDPTVAAISRSCCSAVSGRYFLRSTCWRDLRDLSLIERKRSLRAIMPRVESRVLFIEHIERRGVEFVCRRVRARP
jgi:ATP-dependent DNA ligase